MRIDNITSSYPPAYAKKGNKLDKFLRTIEEHKENQLKGLRSFTEEDKAMLIEEFRAELMAAMPEYPSEEEKAAFLEKLQAFIAALEYALQNQNVETMIVPGGQNIKENYTNNRDFLLSRMNAIYDTPAISSVSDFSQAINGYEDFSIFND